MRGGVEWKWAGSLSKTERQAVLPAYDALVREFAAELSPAYRNEIERHLTNTTLLGFSDKRLVAFCTIDVHHGVLKLNTAFIRKEERRRASGRALLSGMFRHVWEYANPKPSGDALDRLFSSMEGIQKIEYVHSKTGKKWVMAPERFKRLFLANRHVEIPVGRASKFLRSSIGAPARPGRAQRHQPSSSASFAPPATARNRRRH